MDGLAQAYRIYAQQNLIRIEQWNTPLNSNQNEIQIETSTHVATLQAACSTPQFDFEAVCTWPVGLQ
jgi:hypothetical protein